MAARQTHIQYVEHKIAYWRAVAAHDEREAARSAAEAHALIHALTCRGRGILV